MTVESVGKSKLLHGSDPDYSLPSAYSSPGNIKSGMNLPRALRSVCSKFRVKPFGLWVWKKWPCIFVEGCNDFSSINLGPMIQLLQVCR